MTLPIYFLAAVLALGTLGNAGAADAQAKAKVGKRESLPPPPLADAVPVPQFAQWICDDGQLARTRYDVAAGVVQAIRGDERWTLQEQVATNPRRFVAGNDTAVIDGDMAELKRGKSPRATCTRVPDAPTAGRIWGDLLLPQGVTLPAGSRGKVMLVNAARADAPAVELAATRFATRGNQQPFAFLLQFAPETAAPKAQTYRLVARIESAAGKLLYISDTANPVLETVAESAPLEVELTAVSR